MFSPFFLLLRRKFSISVKMKLYALYLLQSLASSAFVKAGHILSVETNLNLIEPVVSLRCQHTNYLTLNIYKAGDKRKLL